MKTLNEIISQTTTANKIRVIMMIRNISTQELSELSGLPYNRIERAIKMNDIKVETLRIICMTLEVDIKDLI